VSRDDLSPGARAQLDALDRVLAHEPVGEEHLELAALVDSVRADAPRMEPEFAARLDAAVAQRLLHGPRLRRPGRGRGLGLRARTLALAGGGLVAAAAALAIVISSGLLQGGRTPAPPAPFGAQTHRKAPTVALPAVGLGHPAAPTAQNGAAIDHGPSASTGTTATNGVPAPASPGGARLVHRSSELELATPAASMQHVANGVVAQTERAGGVVASSYVNVQGRASRAAFSLRVPSARLSDLIVGLSGLASVRALTQDTNDVTSGYDRVLALLSRRRAERAALERRLGHATTAAQARSIRHRIAILDALIGSDGRSAAAFQGEADSASLHVDIVVGAAPRSAAHGGSGPLDRAARTALHALEELLALALVALAIALPIALCVLALWWGAASLRARARERALRAA